MICASSPSMVHQETRPLTRKGFSLKSPVKITVTPASTFSISFWVVVQIKTASPSTWRTRFPITPLISYSPWIVVVSLLSGNGSRSIFL